MTTTSAGDTPDAYYVVRCASAEDARRAIRPLEAFVGTPGGRVRLEGPDRVVVWRKDATLYLSQGALHLAGYVPRDPPVPVAPYLHGPEMTPSRAYTPTPLVPSGRVAAADLPDGSTLVLGRLEPLR